jgi:hypothetical protein
VPSGFPLAFLPFTCLTTTLLSVTVRKIIVHIKITSTSLAVACSGVKVAVGLNVPGGARNPFVMVLLCHTVNGGCSEAAPSFFTQDFEQVFVLLVCT